MRCFDYFDYFGFIKKKCQKNVFIKIALPVLDLRQEIVLSVNAYYIAMVVNGWTPEHLRGIGRRWNAFTPLLLNLKVLFNSGVP